jgi:tRNA G18 (ribose-2'-O)-methylase SpoU
MLRLIATLTDSRFESWLRSLHSHQDDEDINGESNVDNKQYQSTDRQSNSPALYVIVSNLQSGNNIGNILRSASIFGCEEFIVVGQRRYRLTGEHGSRFDLQRRHMWSHKEAKEYLHEKGVRIYGIEIMENAIPVMRYDPETGVVHFPFNREYSGAAFIFGNEGSGLSTKQKEICDEFVYVPQHRGGTKDGGGGGSASLNVASAATVVMQAYCLWAGYSDAKREGEKFLPSSTLGTVSTEKKNKLGLDMNISSGNV